MANLTIHQINQGVVFAAKIVPGSSRTAICGLLNDMLKIKVAAAPERGKANQCLIRFLARTLGVRRNAISITAGQTAVVKHVQVLGMSADTLIGKLNLDKQNLDR